MARSKYTMHMYAGCNNKWHTDSDMSEVETNMKLKAIF